MAERVVMIRAGGDRDMFRATIEDGATDYWFGAVVDEVTTWGEDGSPIEFEPYLHCTIKWDSCSHFRFGEPASGPRGNRDGYLHLCGADDFRRHVELMAELYRLAFERMGREPEPGERWEMANG